MEKQLNKVFIFAAPSGAGKTTLLKAMLQRFHQFQFSVSATTRQPRPKEIDGVHYYFIKVEEFQQLREQDAFLEWEEVYPGKYYGTLKSEVQRIIQQDKCPIFDVDVIGGLHIKEHYEDEAVSIFIQPPNKEVLRERLIHRATDNMEEIEKRLQKATYELSFASRFDHIILNDDLEKAKEELAQTIKRYLVPA